MRQYTIDKVSPIIFKELNQRFNSFVFYKKGDDYNSEKKTMKFYKMLIYGELDVNGNFKILHLDCDSVINYNAVMEFLSNLRFDSIKRPIDMQSWSYLEKFYFRESNPKIAIEEKSLSDSLNEVKKQTLLKIVQIEGVYIPKDLNDCHRTLDSLLKSKDKKEIDSLKSESDMGMYHHGFGTWLRNNWGLWGGSRLSVYFNNMGIFHPDDMSGIILKSYYYYRHKQSFDLDKEVKHYKDYWEKQKKEREKENE